MEVDVDVDVWIKFARDNQLRKNIISFHSYMKKKNENYLSTGKNTSDEDMAYAFQSPRTWHYACDLLDRLEAEGATYNELLCELEQLVGRKASGEYDTYIKLYSTVNIMDILEGRFEISRLKSGDLKALFEQHVVSFALCDQLKVEMLENENWVNNLMVVLTSLHNDIRVIFLSTMNTTRGDVLSKMLESPSCRPYYSEILDAMKRLS